MKDRLTFFNILALLLLLLFSNNTSAQESFNSDWKFLRIKDSKNINIDCSANTFNDSKWENVSLPHTGYMETLLINNPWDGICWYRKNFTIPSYSKESKYYVEFEAAMNKAEIWLNNKKIKTYQGGYLPIVIDMTPYIKSENNVIAVRLDSRDNAVTGPKPHKILDFCMFSGLYRNAWLITKNRVHITNPTLKAKTAGGGVFITYPKVSSEQSIVNIKTNIENETSSDKVITIEYKVCYNGKLVTKKVTSNKNISKNSDIESSDDITINQPKLWSPDSPNLYSLETTVCCNGKQIDSEKTTFGIREFTFVDNQLYINGVKTYLRGVNRHQEYPYIGYALSDNAQYRDAYKIKKAGFNYVRLSHYPQSPAFMDACDRLGLVVADAILGWQYYKENDDFKNFCYNSTRELIRRDRNHPCVFAWEVSLNETQMPIPFMQELHRITHEEYPGKNVYTCGWMPQVYDIYFQARQHRILHKDQMTFAKPYIVSEYGDWEYYSSNAGFNQEKRTKAKRMELSSRQTRANGEKGMLQQAYNIQESHNDNMNIPATGDGYWVMYDYNRGCEDYIESSGVMDIFRLPKFIYNFYSSQKDVRCKDDIELTINNYWTPSSSTDVKVFSNCDKVQLYLNNKLIATQTPDNDKNCTNLKHAPFTFKVGHFEKGTLKAVGFIKDRKVKQTEVTTTEQPCKFVCRVDESGKVPQAGCNDVVFLYISAVDKNGTICHDFSSDVLVKIDDKVEVLNVDGIKTEAGIATVLLKIKDKKGASTISVSSKEKAIGMKDCNFRFNIK